MRSRHKISYLWIVAAFVIGATLVNLGSSALFSALGLKLVFDEWGTVFMSFFASPLAAAITGFSARGFEAFKNPNYLYMSAQSVILTALIYVAKRAGVFEKVWKTIVAILVIGLITGLISSFSIWIFYDFDSMPETFALIAKKLYTPEKFGRYPAVLVSSLVVETVNKAVMLGAVAAAYMLLPRSRREKLEDLLYPYRNAGASMRAKSVSLMTKIALIIVLSEILLCGTAIGSTYYLYSRIAIENFTEKCAGVSESAAALIDPEKVDEYLAAGEAALTVPEGTSEEESAAMIEAAQQAIRTAFPEYARAESEMYALLRAFPDIEYVYAYQIREDGCHVVFDLDTEGLAGGDIGDVIPFDESFNDLKETLIAGGEIDPIITDDTYGYLLTVYTPVKNSERKTVCYMATDINMDDILVDERLFTVKLGMLFIGISIVIVYLIIEILRRRVVRPINEMSNFADKFIAESEEGRNESLETIKGLKVPGDDEIKRLYLSLCKMATDTVDYVDELKTQTAIVVNMQNAIIRDFAELVEARDKNTGNHIKATAYYVKEIAEELRREGKHTDTITDEYVEKLYRMAPLHDIGKIKVSDVILNKPGKLTDEEFAIMKRHTSEGRNILTSFQTFSQSGEFLKEAIEMANYHHERWDGKGYPENLKGDEIPLSARIMAVADVFDALVSRRSYKGPFPYEQAISMIKEESGTHFDPEVVNAFIVISEAAYKEMKE